jgi:LPS-assembly lipoprotein
LSSDRFTPVSRRTALVALMALAGCGLTPVYGTNGQANILRDAVSFGAPDTVAGFRLRDRLEERLGRAAAPKYALGVQLSQTLTPATITVDGDTTRFNLVGTADWVLRSAEGSSLTSGQVETFTSFSATGSTVATEAAAADAAARLSVALADLIVSRLILAASDLPR